MEIHRQRPRKTSPQRVRNRQATTLQQIPSQKNLPRTQRIQKFQLRHRVFSIIQ